MDEFGREALVLASQPSMPIENLRPTITIIEEVQCSCKMLKIVGTNVAKINHEEDGPILHDLDLSDNEDEDGRPMQNLGLGTSEDVTMESLDTLQDVYTMLYVNAWCSKLATTLTLMNMCTIHGCFNQFVDFIFILHNFLLPMDNYLSSNLYGAKTLTQHIGLKYNKIHACSYGCVLYRGEYANFTQCPKCGKERYKQVGRIVVPTKILWHFPLIP